MTEPPEPRRPRVSLVIPVKNEAKRIAACLANLKRQTLAPVEILIVDGHSHDGTVPIAKAFGVRVFFEDYGTRAGAGQIGIENAVGEFVAFTDADCLPEPRWLETLVAGFSPGIVGVGGRIVNEGDTFVQRSIDAALDTPLGSANSVQGRIYERARFVSSISGCNSMYRREDLIAAGGFSPHLVTTEDTELNRRMLKRGRLLYTPAAVVHHRHGRGLRDFARRMFQYGYGRGQSLLLGPTLAVPLALPLLAASFLLKPIVGIAILAAYAVLIFGTAGTIAARKRDVRYLATVPVVLVLEHASYVAGFWVGAFRTRLPHRRRSRMSSEDAS